MSLYGLTVTLMVDIDLASFLDSSGDICQIMIHFLFKKYLKFCSALVKDVTFPSNVIFVMAILECFFV